MMKILIAASLLWVIWLLYDALTTGGVWVKGGSKDRFTRDLDMHSFATKKSRHEHPFIYWFMMLFYTGVAILLFLYLFDKLPN